jgi:hypothetical protein
VPQVPGGALAVRMLDMRRWRDLTVGCLNRHLFYHNGSQLTPEMLELAYQCPVDLIAHGVPHRVFAEQE